MMDILNSLNGGLLSLVVLLVITSPYTSSHPGVTTEVDTYMLERAPGPPRDLRAELRGSTSVYLTWLPPRYTGGQGHITYSLYYSRPQGGGYKMQLSTTDTKYIVYQLLPHTNYTFYVESYNPTTATISAEHSNIVRVFTRGTVCEPPEIANARLGDNRTSYMPGELTELTCVEGYRVPYTKSVVLHLRCHDDGSWLNFRGMAEVPTCQKIGSCQSPAIPHSVVIRQNTGFMPGDVIPVKCEPGYHPVDSHQYLIVCEKDGTWRTKNKSVQLPSCQVWTCKIPSEFPHGSIKKVVNPDLEGQYFEPDEVPYASSIQYNCNTGYVLDKNHRTELRCLHGTWNDSQPYCVRELSYPGCHAPQQVLHASTDISPREGTGVHGNILPQGSQVTYRCDEGYTQRGRHYMLLCLDGKWMGIPPACDAMGRHCGSPPNIAHGNFSSGRTVVTLDAPEYTEGVEVSYFCNTGYRLAVSDRARLICVGNEWKGKKPICERRTRCDRPLDIENGNWLIRALFIPNYGIGTEIGYTCLKGYKQIGTSNIECLPSGYWSDHAPQCLPATKYCNEPGVIEHGAYLCDPPHCDLFKVGTAVHYVCNKDYAHRESDLMVQRCMAEGIWSGQKPLCQSIELKAVPDTTHLNTNTLTVVIATSCGVLGLLAIIMVIVALQRRRKPRSSRLCHPSTPPPPPYPSPPTGLVDEPDRVALIAFADGVQVVLPSYDEAIRGRPSSRLARYNSDSTRGSVRSSCSRGDYRPLPSLPSSMRGAGSQLRELPPDHHRDHHRNSIITTTSITTRDNLSLTLGSIDTMNISDGTSTSVTVDTASSNPSIATSQRAAAGSIESSSTNGSIATEDAPLLEQNHYNTETMRSHHSNTSDTTHNAPQRCQCPDRSGYDTLHSQSSRSQGEPSPIVELPEEQKHA